MCVCVFLVERKGKNSSKMILPHAPFIGRFWTRVGPTHRVPVGPTESPRVAAELDQSVAWDGWLVPVVCQLALAGGWRVAAHVWHTQTRAEHFSLTFFAISWAYELRFARRFRLRIRLDKTDLMTLKSPLEDDLSFIVIFNDYSSFIGYHVVSKPRIGFSFLFHVHLPYYVPYNFHVRCARRFDSYRHICRELSSFNYYLLRLNIKTT